LALAAAGAASLAALLAFTLLLPAGLLSLVRFFVLAQRFRRAQHLAALLTFVLVFLH
jgi:hypothetical protein